jgi:hypothetical protein
MKLNDQMRVNAIRFRPEIKSDKLVMMLDENRSLKEIIAASLYAGFEISNILKMEFKKTDYDKDFLLFENIHGMIVVYK